MLNWDDKIKQEIMDDEVEGKGIEYMIETGCVAMEMYAEVNNVPIHNIVEVHNRILSIYNSLLSPYQNLTCRVPEELWRFIGNSGYFTVSSNEDYGYLESVRTSHNPYTSIRSLRAMKYAKERVTMTAEELEEHYGYGLEYGGSERITEMLNTLPKSVSDKPNPTIQDVLNHFLKNQELTKPERVMTMKIMLELAQRYVTSNVHLKGDITIQEVLESEWEEDGMVG